MNICVVGRAYPESETDLEGIFERDQARALSDTGDKVAYAALDFRSIRHIRKLGLRHFYDGNLEVFSVSVPLGRIQHYLFTAIGKVASTILFKKIFNSFGTIDVVHTHFGTRGEIVAPICKNNHIPLVVTEHESKMNKACLSRQEKKQAIQNYRYAQRCIAVSQPLADNLKKQTGFDFTVVHNIVDTSCFSYREHPKSNSDCFSFVSAGNLIEGKNFQSLITAFAETQKEFNNITLDIFGDGPERKAITEQINNLGLESKITLHGRTTRKVLGSFLAHSDAFVLASKGETFGVVYIEALASGLPVIATACGGPEDFINDNNGIIVPLADINCLCTAMKRIITTYSQYDPSSIAEEALKAFSPEMISSQLNNIYIETIKKYQKGIL